MTILVRGKLKLLFLILIILTGFHSSPALAQQAELKITGQVFDTAASNTVRHAVVMGVRISDSVLVNFTRTNTQGMFDLRLPVDTYQVIITHPQFGDQTYIFLGNSADTILDAGRIIMPAKSVTLREVTVYGYTDPVYYRGDTLVYTADSFEVKQNAVVEDLLKKLPGIRVDKDGKIFSEEKPVDQLLVDGDEFFGSDPTVATKNLGARSVQSVEIYEKKKEGASDDNEMMKVMDLKLKEDAKKGYFGKASAGSDFTEFHEGQVMFNRFRDKQKISLFGLKSNTPNSSLQWDDMFKYGFESDMNFFDDDELFRIMSNKSNGIPDVIKTGFYYNDYISEKTKVSANYTYGRSDVREEISRSSLYYFPDTLYSVDRSNQSSAVNTGQSLNLTVSHTIDTMTSIEIKSRNKSGKATQNASELQSYFSEDESPVRSTDISIANSGKSISTNNTVKLNKSFGVKDRKLTAEYNLVYEDNDADGILQFREYFNANDSTAGTDQKKENNMERISHYGELSFTEPVSKKVKIEISADHYYSEGRQDKLTLDFANGSYSAENPALTNRFESVRQVSKAGLKFTYDVRKQTVSAGTRARRVELQNTNLVTNEKLSNTVRHLLPFFTYRYRFSDNSSFNLRYNSSSREPNLNQLQPVPDNSNPNVIYTGNPFLRPTFQHRVSAGFNSFRPVSGKSFFGNVTFNSTENAFANFTEYDSLGRKISMPVNVDGNYNVAGYISYTYPIFKKVITARPFVSVNYSHTTGFVNGQKNITKNTSPSGNLEVTFRKGIIEWFVSAGYNFNRASTSVSQLSRNNYSTSEYSSQLTADLPLKLTLTTYANYTMNNRRSEGYNINYLIWNAKLEKKMLKNDRLIIAIDANDLLNQNIDSYREVSENIISDIRSRVIGRYILFRLTYSINSTNQKEDE